MKYTINKTKHRKFEVKAGTYAPLKIAVNHGVQVCTFEVPKGAVYGRITKNLYMYILDFDQFQFNMSSYDVFILDLRIGKGFRKGALLEYDPALPAVQQFLKENKLTHIVKPTDSGRKLSKALQLAKPHESTSRCYKQSMVDGKGYSIDHEYRYIEDDNYIGMPTTYNEILSYKDGKVDITPYGSFAGVTDTDIAKRRDGMKIKQTSIRPERKGSKKIKNYNGKITINKEEPKTCVTPIRDHGVGSVIKSNPPKAHCVKVEWRTGVIK